MNQLITYWESLSSLSQIQFVVFVSAIVTYVWHIIKDKEFTPNPLAFGIWLVGDSVSFLTYIRISDLWLGPAIMPSGALTVFIYSVVRVLKKKKLEIEAETDVPLNPRLSPDQWIALGLAVCSFLLWGFTAMNVLANMAIQASLAIGFYFIVTDIVKSKSSNEPLLSWSLFLIGWSVAGYETALLCKTKWELVLPLVNGGGALLTVFLTLYYERKYIV